VIKLKLLLEQLAHGLQWHACKAWNSKGGTSYWNGDEGRPKITIAVNNAGFHLKYIGAISGYAIAHRDDSTTDSLHQAFNIVMCECNPYLLNGGLKPDIKNIKTNHSVANNKHIMNIWIPFVKTDGVWQVNRRGGMGHDPGEQSILSEIGKVNNLEGPVKVKVATITEYFVTYTISTVKSKQSTTDKPATKSADRDKVNVKKKPSYYWNPQ
jgi:hypothetical protein